MKTLLASMVEDQAGGISSMRVLLVLWILCLTTVWVVMAFKSWSIPDIPNGVLGLTGTFLATKAFQRMGEKPAP